jgi:hypothetical protein
MEMCAGTNNTAGRVLKEIFLDHRLHSWYSVVQCKTWCGKAVTVILYEGS